MAFVVEDGTGLQASTAYIEVAFADDYFADRNVTLWSSYSQLEKEAAIIAATDYVDARWGSLFKGQVIFLDQALLFPRSAFDGIPTLLKKAVAEYALRAASAPLAPDPEQDPSGYQVSRKMEKVGPIEERTDFAFMGPGASRRILRSYPAADMLLHSLLRDWGSGRVIRYG